MADMVHNALVAVLELTYLCVYFLSFYEQTLLAILDDLGYFSRSIAIFQLRSFPLLRREVHCYEF